MAHLAPGAGFALAVEMEVRAGFGDQRGPTRRHRRRSDCPSSRAGGDQRGSPSGSPQIARICCSNCEVSGALDRPVAAIVDARRHLVDDRPVGAGEEFDRQHADMVERRRRAAGDRASRFARPGARSAARRDRASGAGCRRRWTLRADRPSCACRHRRSRASDDRKFGVEVDRAPRPSPAGGRSPPTPPCASPGVADPGLALAVIAEAPAS